MSLLLLLGNGSSALDLVTANRIAEYRFDEGAGQAVTDHQGGLTATLGSAAGADTNDPAWVQEGLSFDAVDDYVRAPVGAVGGSGAFTAMAVALLSGNGNYPHILGQNPAGKGVRLLFAGIERRLFVNVQNVAGTQTSSGSSVNVIPLNSWYCFTARFTPGSRLEGFENTTKTVDVATVIADRSAGTELLFGSDGPAGAQTFPGKIAYLLTYDRALSDAEIEQNYTVLRTRLGSRGVTLP